jgi:hypothetical protein
MKKPKTEITIYRRIVIAAALLGLQATAAAQVATPGFTDSKSGGNLFGIQGQKLSYIDKNGKPLEMGKTFSETIPGNGTRAGYSLSHGGVIPDSVSVSVGAHTLKANRDYYLDPSNGTISFVEPVRRLDSVHVYYRYIEGQDANRSGLGMSGLSLNFNGTSVNLGFGVSQGAGGLDFSTYGFGLNSKVGSGGSLNGMFYVSNPNQNRNNVVGETRASLTPLAAKNQDEAKSDHLITQNLTLKSGNANFRASYQDIGQHFNGFQAMKQANAKNADVMSQLNAMEKEKGVKRLGFGAGLSLQKKSADNLGFNWDKISDGKGEIINKNLGYQSKGLTFNISEQTVGENFTRFADLREANQAQLAKEKGIKRNDLTLGFNGGKNGGLLGFSQNAVGDKSGKLFKQAFNYTSKNFNFAMTDRKADAGFARIGDLSDAEKTALALDIRKQFNVNATAAEVTAKDKEQIVLDKGLHRNQMAFSGGLTKQGAFAFNQFEIGDGNGKISRRTLNLTGKKYAFNYLDQSIDEKFGRLAGMSDFEKTQFANEQGVHRTALGLMLTLGKTSTLNVSQLNIGDKAGAVARQSLAYCAKGLDFRFNLADTAKNFARANDLAGLTPVEKAQMEAERGYKRTDYALNVTELKGVKGLTLSTSVYDARNGAENLSKEVFKHNLAWQMNKGSLLTLLSEGNMFDMNGKAQDGTAHDLYTFDKATSKGMKLSMYHDSFSRVVGGTVIPTTITDFMHLESNKAKPTNFMTEMKRIDMGDGHFENTTQLDMNYRSSKTLSFHFNKLGIDRGKDPSSDTDMLQWNWQMNKGLGFTGSFATTSTNNNTDIEAKSFGLTGGLTKNLNVTGTYMEVLSKGKTAADNSVKSVADIAISNVKPINVKALGLKGVTIAGHYAATNDKKKTQAENMSGKLAGMVGKNQLCMEYGGILNPNGQTAIARIINFISDPNPKLPFHFDLLYKSRNINRDKVCLVRKYNAAYKMDKLTTATYTYSSLPEDAAGNPQPLKSSAFTLRRAINKNISLAVDYTSAKQMAAKTEQNKLGALVAGKVDKLSTIEVGYSVDVNDVAGQTNRSDSHTLKLSYDHQVDGDHFITISTIYTMYACHTPDAIQANFDFRTRF